MALLGPPAPLVATALLYIYLLEAIGDRIFLFLPRHAKIRYFDNVFFSHQTISGCQISVDTIF